jgi:hypothetical protein
VFVGQSCKKRNVCVYVCVYIYTKRGKKDRPQFGEQKRGIDAEEFVAKKKRIDLNLESKSAGSMLRSSWQSLLPSCCTCAGLLSRMKPNM